MNLLILFVDSDETWRLDCDESPDFDLIVVVSSKVEFTALDSIHDYYSDYGIIPQIEILEEETKEETKVELLRLFYAHGLDVNKYDRIGLCFPGVKASVSNINKLFEASVVNHWTFCHPALNETVELKNLIFRSDSYPEYVKEMNGTRYSVIPFIPFLLPVMSTEVYKEIGQLTQTYSLKSEQGFVMHWIPELLTRLKHRHAPVLVRSATIDAPTFTINWDEGFCESYKKCYEWIQDQYPLSDAIESYCISLNDPGSDWRKKQFTEAAEKHNEEFTWFEAIDGRQWKPNDYPSWIAHQGYRIDYHEPLTGGEVGVAASHRALIEKGWESQAEAIVVFEDDAVICKTLACVEVPIDADILMINDRAIKNKDFEIVIGTCGTDGYIITRRGMFKLLQILEHVNMPLDFMIVAHAKSMCKCKSIANTISNPLNPKLQVYHNEVYVRHYDQGQSTIGHSLESTVWI